MGDTGKRTPVYAIVPGKDGHGNHIFSVLVKRTYVIRPGEAVARAETDGPFIRVDEYYDRGGPEITTVKYETDLAPYKAATDVVVVGKAYTSGGKPTDFMVASLEIAGVRKVIHVIGDRQCIYRDNKTPQFTEPVPFTVMEIRYDRAYGGKDLKSHPALPFYYPRNHMGKGIAIKNTRESIDGLVLPNLEDPEDLLTPERVAMGEPTRWNQQPLPQGFGWFQKTWYPRCTFVGSVPGFVDPGEVMREELLGVVPRGQIALARQFKLPGFDVRFNNGASLGLALPYLSGDEPVKLTGLTPEGVLTFTLPKERPRIVLDIGLGENELQTVLHTVCIRMETMEVDLLWRGAHQYPGFEWLPQMKKMEVTVF